MNNNKKNNIELEEIIDLDHIKEESEKIYTNENSELREITYEELLDDEEEFFDAYYTEEDEED